MAPAPVWAGANLSTQLTTEMKTLFAVLGLVLAFGADAADRRNVRRVGPEQNLYQVKRDTDPPALIVCEPGTYTKGVTNLFKDRVDWHFENCLLEFTDIPTNTGGWGIFDDRFSGGAITSKITGTLEIHYSSGTNVWVDPADRVYGYNTNALGAIVITNARSLVQIDASIDARVYGLAPIPKVLYVGDCQTNSYFRTFNRVSLWQPAGVLSTNDLYQVVLRTNYLDPADLLATVGNSFMRWNEGTMHCSAGDVYATDYVLDCYNEKTNSTELFFDAGRIDGKIYVVGKTNNWKVWSRVQEHKNTGINLGANAINCYGAGAHYFEAMKVSSRLGAVLQLENPNSPDSNLVVWVNFDKVSGSNGWVNVSHGALRGRVGHFEWNGPAAETGGIITTNLGLVSLTGETMEAPRTAVFHGAGRTELFNYFIRSTNRDPVFTAAAGLRLHSTVLVPGTGATNAVRANGSVTVGALGTLLLKSNAHANITFTSGTTNVIVDSDTD